MDGSLPARKPPGRAKNNNIETRNQIILKIISIVAMIGFFVHSGVVFGLPGIWIGITGVIIGYFFGVVSPPD